MSYLSEKIVKLGNREYIDMGRSVNFLPTFFSNGSKYCLVGTQEPKFAGGSELYCLGGYVDSDDISYLGTALRELKEEANLDHSHILVGSNVYTDLEVASGYSNERNTLYILECFASSVEDIRTNDADEITRFAVINISTLDISTIKDKQLRDAIVYAKDLDLGLL